MATSNTGASPLVMGAQGDTDSRRLRVRWVRWVGATDAGHTMSLKDTAGNVVAQSEADGANFIDIIPVFQIFTGLNLETKQSGTVFVYYD